MNFKDLGSYFSSTLLQIKFDRAMDGELLQCYYKISFWMAPSEDPRREFVVPIGRRSGVVKQGGYKGQVLEF